MKNLTTEAGQTEQQHSTNTALIDALNQIFALFKRNYHNQFFKAFAQESDVVAVKRLWLESLANYEPEIILGAGMAIVKSSEFLPTLKAMLTHCERLSNRLLPDVHAAYAEACNAASPKLEQKWSHPAVYFAGRDTGWHFLQSNVEYVAFPVFKEHYQNLVERSRAGENLVLPKVEIKAKLTQKPASAETSKQYMDNLQSLFDDNEK